VGYWPLDEGQGTTPLDWSGDGGNGSFNGGPTWTQGHVWANAVQMNGTVPSYITLNLPASSMPTSSMTFAEWFNVNTSTFISTHLITNGALTNAGAWYVSVGAGMSSVIDFIMYNASDTPSTAACPNLLATSTWEDVAASYNGTIMSVYVNGAFCTSLPASIGPLYQGTNLTTNPNNPGALDIQDDVRLYDRALSAAEIQEIYNAEK
jgi:hypothetical protein